MEYLERYLIQIGRYLAKKDRQDTINELRDLLMENFDNFPDQSLSEEEKNILEDVLIKAFEKEGSVYGIDGYRKLGRNQLIF